MREREFKLGKILDFLLSYLGEIEGASQERAEEEEHKGKRDEVRIVIRVCPDLH